MIARQCDAYVMHGDPPERIAPKIAEMRERRERASETLGVDLPPMQFGVAAYAIVRDSRHEIDAEIERITNVTEGSPGYGNYRDWIANTKLEQQVSLQDYSVSNRGLRAGLVGTPDEVAERTAQFAAAGVDLLLLQCSPQLEGNGAVCGRSDLGHSLTAKYAWAHRFIPTGPQLFRRRRQGVARRESRRLFVERSSNRKPLACNELNFRIGARSEWPNYYLIVQNFSLRTPLFQHGQSVLREDFAAPAYKLQ